MNDTKPQPRSSSEATRAALIEAGLTLFGQKGFAATTTREIAAAAGANVAAIAYHFGGKEGLRDACAAHIVRMVQSIAGPVLGDLPAPPDEAAAMAQLRAVVYRVAGFLLASPEAGRIVQFILREMQQPTAALDILYGKLFEPMHRRFCEIWAAATGEDAESEESRIAVFTLIGQVVYFRVGREAVLRRMEWQTIGPRETELIAEAVFSNIVAILAARRRPRP